MKTDDFLCFFYVLRCLQKMKTIILSYINYNAMRLHYKFIILILTSLMVVFFFILVYLQMKIGMIRKNFILTRYPEKYYIPFNITGDVLVEIPSMDELRVEWIQNKMGRISKKMKRFMTSKLSDLKELPVPNYRVHVFYYTWFRTQTEDGSWRHWDVDVNNKDSVEKHSLASVDILSSFYPQHGCYSSRNLSVIDNHMKMIRKAGIGVIVVSWLPSSLPDSPKSFLHMIMDITLKYQIKVSFQIYFYKNRTLESIRNEIKYLTLKFRGHPSLYLLKKNNKLMPVFYIHDSYKINASLWNELLSENGNITVRKTTLDATFIGHLTEQRHDIAIKHASFDGLYTYSSGNGLTYGSSWKNWKWIAKFCKKNRLIFIPSVGPGFSDFLWNKNIKHRLNGNYYEVGWRSALSTNPEFVSITSFNNWQDGSQIEPAIPMKTEMRTYLDYEPEGPQFYIDLTRWWVKQFVNMTQ